MEKEFLRTIRQFESYVKWIWPIHRKLAKGNYSKRCRICVASEHMSPLNKDSVCGLCEKYQNSDNANKYQVSDDELKRFQSHISQSLESTQSKRYDALVLYSGGKDSSYLIHRLRSEFPKIKILSLSLDNNFMSPVAKANIGRMVEKMNLDHIFYRPPKSFYVKLFRYTLTHLNENGCYGTVDFSDGEFLLDTARHFAASLSIPLIFCGYSRFQVQNGLELEDFLYPQQDQLNDRTHVAGLKLSDIFHPDEIRLWWTPTKNSFSVRPDLVFPFYVWDPSETEVRTKVKEWGLIEDVDQSPAVTNHQLIPLLGVVDVHRWGYSSFEIELCRMIREGKAQADQWRGVFEFLEYTARTGKFVRPTIDGLLKELNLKRQDVGIKW